MEIEREIILEINNLRSNSISQNLNPSSLDPTDNSVKKLKIFVMIISVIVVIIIVADVILFYKLFKSPETINEISNNNISNNSDNNTTDSNINTAIIQMKKNPSNSTEPYNDNNIQIDIALNKKVIEYIKKELDKIIPTLDSNILNSVKSAQERNTELLNSIKNQMESVKPAQERNTKLLNSIKIQMESVKPAQERNTELLNSIKIQMEYVKPAQERNTKLLNSIKIQMESVKPAQERNTKLLNSIKIQMESVKPAQERNTELLNSIKIQMESVKPAQERNTELLNSIKLTVNSNTNLINKIKPAKESNTNLINTIKRAQEGNTNTINTIKPIVNNNTNKLNDINITNNKQVLNYILTKIFNDKIQSNIVSHEQMQFVIDKIKETLNVTNLSYRRLFSVKEDGDRSLTFHRYVNGMANTIVLVKSDLNYIFGGFTTLLWNGNIKNFIPGIATSSFIFSIDKQKIVLHDQNVNKYTLYSHTSYGPTFGEAYDIYVRDKCKSNSLSNVGPNSTYGVKDPDMIKNPYLLNGGTYNFRCLDYEVFQVKPLEIIEDDE